MATYLSGGRIQGSTTAPATATLSEDNTSDNFTQVIETSGVPLSPETRWGVDYQNVYVKTVGQAHAFSDDSLNMDANTSGGGMRYTGSTALGKLRSVKVYVKKTGTPSGNVYCRLYKAPTLSSADPTVAETASGTFNVSALTTTYEYRTFTFDGSNDLEQYDVISIEQSDGSSGSKLNLGQDAGTGTANWSTVSRYSGTDWDQENTGQSHTWVIKAGSNKGLTVNAARNNGSQGEYISLGSTYSGDFICRFSYKALVPSDEWSYGSGSESYAPYLHVGLCSLNTCDSNTSQNFAGIQHLPMAGDSKPYVCFAHATGSIQGQSSGGGLSGSWTGSNSVEDGTTVDQYYAEIVKDGTTVTVNFYTDSTYETLYGTNSITRSSSETDSYSYFVAMGMDFATNPYGSMSVFIDDIQIWKDTTTPTGDEKATITNVPAGSRYEEIDTRKIYRINPIGTGLKAYYKLNTNYTTNPQTEANVASTVSGSTATDMGTNADISIINQPTQVTSGVPSGLDDANLFNGTDEYGKAGSLANRSQWNFLHDTTAKWTLNVWLKFPDGEPSSNTYLWSDAEATDTQPSMQLRSRGTYWRFIVCNASGVVLNTNDSPQLPIPQDDDWHMYTLRYDYSQSSDTFIYSVDGATSGTYYVTDDKTGTATDNAGDVEPFFMADGYGGLYGEMNATACELAIWQDKILSNEQVTKLYNSGNGVQIDSGVNIWTERGTAA